MQIEEYIKQRFQQAGAQLSDADLLDIMLRSNLDSEASVTSDNMAKIDVAMANFIPSLLARPKSISESGFSVSFNADGLKRWYSYLAKRYGLRDELDTEKPEVRFI